MIAALILLTVTGLVCGVQVMNDASLKDVDIEARREVLGKIVDKLNSIALEQRSLIDGCEEQINNTVDACNACRQDLCQPTQSVDQVVLNMLSTGANTGIAFAGKALEDAGDWFKNSGDWMGDQAGIFSHRLSTLANTIADQFERSGQAELNKLSNGFRNLGQDFKNVGDKINTALGNPLGGFMNLGKGIANLDNYIGTALSGVNNLLNSFANTMESWGNSIKNFFTGRRRRMLLERRCVASCPICDKLDKDKYTVEQMTTMICGQTTVSSQNTAISDIAWLKTTFNDTIDNTIVTKVDYDTASIQFVNGAVVFSTSHYETADGDRKKYGQILNIGNNTETGIGIASEYFTKIFDARVTV
ncbi:uncharacterized protein LOC127704465 isoform X2 [Mytilus californianus]|uniref:uncharacterized protein LOC127704465 isoform X1 n=1 Tax=Mytilus californianus TaxID=6549 RepID=UPI0022486F9C|nr:uncharacterized protein LOC127704465 isoform X1 [Mytilus californianus]XP_052064512.1 uncharacterized protein LOC127704465 isoform X2 [Mytilus californianus]